MLNSTLNRVRESIAKCKILFFLIYVVYEEDFVILVLYLYYNHYVAEKFDREIPNKLLYTSLRFIF